MPMSFLRERQLLARRDADHLLDQIDAGDRLGHRVLDLEAGVHFEEVEALAAGVRAAETISSTVPAL